MQHAADPSFDRTKTLTELEDDDWGEPTYDSHVVRSSHAYRKMPVARLGTEELRMLVGQSIGMPHLVWPLLETLERDPLAEGDFYPGDLMEAALRAQNHLFWLANPPLLERLLAIAPPGPSSEGLRALLSGGPMPDEHHDLRFRDRVRLRELDEPLALPTVWERVLSALEEDPHRGGFRCQLLLLTTIADHDLFWLSHRDALRRLLAVLDRVDDERLRSRTIALRWAFTFKLERSRA